MLIECGTCDARVDARMAGDYKHMLEELGEPIRFVLLECPVCHSPQLAYQEIKQTGPNDYDWTEARRLYPGEREISTTVPTPIRKSFAEALLCQNAGAHLAAVAMCRRTLEAMAVDRLGKIRNLATAIGELHREGVIDDRLKEWADALRQDGNLAVHDAEAVITSEDAADIIDFTEAILEYVFVLHERFEAFRKRRSGGQT